MFDSLLAVYKTVYGEDCSADEDGVRACIIADPTLGPKFVCCITDTDIGTFLMLHAMEIVQLLHGGNVPDLATDTQPPEPHTWFAWFRSSRVCFGADVLEKAFITDRLNVSAHIQQYANMVQARFGVTIPYRVIINALSGTSPEAAAKCRYAYNMLTHDHSDEALLATLKHAYRMPAIVNYAIYDNDEEGDYLNQIRVHGLFFEDLGARISLGIGYCYNDPDAFAEHIKYYGVRASVELNLHEAVGNRQCSWDNDVLSVLEGLSLSDARAWVYGAVYGLTNDSGVAYLCASVVTQACEDLRFVLPSGIMPYIYSYCARCVGTSGAILLNIFSADYASLDFSKEDYSNFC